MAIFKAALRWPFDCDKVGYKCNKQMSKTWSFHKPEICMICQKNVPVNRISFASAR